MKRRGLPFLVVLACLVSARVQAQAPSTTSAPWPPPPDLAVLSWVPSPKSVPFEMTHDMGEYSHIVASYRGRLVLDSLGLHLELGQETRIARNPAAQDSTTRLDSIALAIAEPAPEGYRIVDIGPAWVPARRASPLDGRGTPAALRLPGVGPADLIGRWPLLVHYIHGRTSYQEKVPPAITIHAQGRVDIFRDLLAPAETRRRGSPAPGFRLPAASPFQIENRSDARAAAFYLGVMGLSAEGLKVGLFSSGRIELSDAMVENAAGSESFTLALAERSPSGWRIVQRGTPVVARNPRKGREQYVISDTLRMSGVTPEDLVDRWPVLVHGFVIERNYERTRFEIVIQGDRDAFDPLLTPKPWNVY